MAKQVFKQPQRRHRPLEDQEAPQQLQRPSGQMYERPNRSPGVYDDSGVLGDADDLINDSEQANADSRSMVDENERFLAEREKDAASEQAGEQEQAVPTPQEINEAEQQPDEPSLYTPERAAEAEGGAQKQKGEAGQQPKGKKGFLKRHKRKIIMGGGLAGGATLVTLMLQLGTLLFPTLTTNIENNRFKTPIRHLTVNMDIITKLKLKIDSTGDAEYLRALNTYADQPTTGLWAKVNRYRPAKVAEQLLLDTDFEYRQRRVLGTNIVRERVVGVEINGRKISIPERSTPLLQKVTHPIKYWRGYFGARSEIIGILKERTGARSIWYRVFYVNRAMKLYMERVANINRVRWSKADVEEADKRARANREEARSEAIKDSYDQNRPRQPTPASDAARVGQQQTDACIADSQCRDHMVRQQETVSPQTSADFRTRFSPSAIRGVINTIGSVSELGGIACLVAKAGISTSPHIINANRSMAAGSFASMAAASGQQVYTQQNEGDVRVAASLTGGYNDQVNYDGGANRSNPMRRASGLPFDTSNTLSPESSAVGLLASNPFRFLPGNIMQTLNGSTFCDLMGNIWFQGGVTLAEIAASLIPGVGQAVKAGGTATAKTVSVIVAKQLGNVLKQQFSKTQLVRMAAVGGVGTAAELTSAVEHTRALQEMGAIYNGASQGEDYVNQADAGATVLAQENLRQMGGRPLTTNEHLAVERSSTDFQRQLAMEQGFSYRYLALSNPDSLLHRTASGLYLNFNLNSLSVVIERAASVFNPAQIFSGLPGIGQMTAFAQEQNIEAPIMQREYGVTQWGWSEDEEAAYISDDEFAPLYNEDRLDASERRIELENKYGKCFDPTTGSMGDLLADEHIYRDDVGNVLPGEGKDCDPDKIGALSPERAQNFSGTYTLGSLTFRNEEAALVFRYRVSIRNHLAVDQLLDIQDPQSDNAAGVSNSGLVNSDGYAFPMAPGTKRDYATLPCTPARYQAPGVCHHDGTGAFDLFFGPDGTTDGLDVFAISDGEIVNASQYGGVAGCYAIQFRSTRDSHYYWYGHLQNPQVSTGDPVVAGQKIAEVARNSLGSNCRGGRDHLHIDRGCVINGVPQTAGRQSCRDPSFVDFMNDMWERLPADGSGGASIE